MALIVTPGADDADSYLTVAAADARATGSDDGPEREAWLALDDERKERVLRRATIEIDLFLEPTWSRHSATQALQFPRSGDTTAGSPYIPAKVQVATYQQAIYLAKNARVLAAMNVRRETADGAGAGAFQLGPDVGPSPLSPLAQLALARYRKVPGARSAGLGSVRMSAGIVRGS